MKSREMYMVASIVGPLVGLAGMAGMFGFGLPGPYWLGTVLIGAALILFGQRGLKQIRPVINDPSEIHNELLAKKRYRFWIFVAIACSLYSIASYWLPLTTPEIRKHLAEAIMLLTFLLCVGIFIYSTNSNREP